jgi:uncharacterized protein (UPF0332 family)
MTFATDLIEQARTIASADLRRPKQANLRRAVSAAYYALFHEIIDRAVTSVVGASRSDGPVGRRLRRSVQHTSVLRAAKWFAPAAQRPAAVNEMRSDSAAVPRELEAICRAVVKLQEQRHRADYDLYDPFVRSEALRLVQDAETAIGAVRAMGAEGDELIFLLGCLMGEAMLKNA